MLWKELLEKEFGFYEVVLWLGFWKMFFRCSLKFSSLSRNIPKCFWREVCETTFWLKNKWMWLIICPLREKISSSAYLVVGSGLKFIFYWNGYSPIIFKSLFRSIFEVSAFLTTEYSEVSVANNLRFDDKFLDKLFI